MRLGYVLPVALIFGCVSADNRWNSDENRLLVATKRDRSKPPSGAIQFIDNRVPHSADDYFDYNTGTSSSPMYDSSEYHSEPKQVLNQKQHGGEPHHHRGNDVSYKQHQPPRATASWSNRALYKTHQKGSSLIPYPGATVNVLPRSGNRKAYRGSVVATIVTPKPFASRRRIHAEAQPSGDEPARVHADCIRCPEERTLISNIGQDKVLLEDPALVPCYGKSATSHYKFGVVFGVKPGDLLPAGSHVAVGKVINTKHNKFVQMCQWKINVIVQQCPRVSVTDNVHVECPNGHVWGATCQYSCKDPEHILVGSNTTSCDDDLKWTGGAPVCVAGSTCLPPAVPLRGRMSCETPSGSADYDDSNAVGRSLQQSQESLPKGTVCHVVCGVGLRIPPRKAHLATTACISGRWSVQESVRCQRSRRRKHARHPKHQQEEES